MAVRGQHVKKSVPFVWGAYAHMRSRATGFEGPLTIRLTLY